MSALPIAVPPSGRTLMEAIRDGTWPRPRAADVLDLRLVEVGDGVAAFELDADERFDNSRGSVHGGILAAVADFAVTTAVLTRLDIDTPLVTATLNVAYLRPVRPGDGTLRAEGRVVHLGRRLAHAEAILLGPDGRMRMTATATCHLGGT